VSTTKSLPVAIRLVLATIIVMLALLVLVGGWTIPFSFESFSIQYKFGLEKTYLRSGKVIGITIVLLIFFQLLLASRLSIMEQLFSARRLFFLHRSNGMAIAFLLLAHPLLIKASENFTPYTFEEKYYPEFLGMAALAVLVVLLFTAVFRKFFRLSYGGWLLLHRFSATLTLVLMPSHVLSVSETFKAGIPYRAALLIFSLNLLMMIRVWWRRLRYKNGQSR